jgi:thiol:disulfide interchange protein DsbD
MVRIILGFVLVSFFGPVQPNPVSWTFYTKKISEGDYELHMKARIDKGWHIFALNNVAGPGPTNFNFRKHSGIKYEGSVSQLTRPSVINDQAFKTEVLGFAGGAEFIQIIRRKDSTVNNIDGTIRYMPCNGANCLAPITDSFQVALN